ncbi:MAG: D-sedoheptulose 7-phosphate isomerase [Bacteroidia bacterium]
MNLNEIIKGELIEAQKTLEVFLSDPAKIEAISEAVEVLCAALQSGNKVISCGNGGSMCDAMHFAEELSGKFRNDRPALPAMAISDPSHITCTANDFGFEQVFARYVEAFGHSGDVLLAISTSGNSANILKAATVAKSKGMQVIGLTGKSGGQLTAHCDIEIRVSHDGFADRIQELHIKIIHCLILGIEQRLFR